VAPALHWQLLALRFSDLARLPVARRDRSEWLAQEVQYERVKWFWRLLVFRQRSQASRLAH
jgi:hypothetical protein